MDIEFEKRAQELREIKMVIRTVAGLPVEEPYLFTNIQKIFPDMDYENLPSGWKKFFRDPIPRIGPYEVFSHSEKILEGNSIREIQCLRPMTQEEKDEKLARMKETPRPFPSWSFSEEQCRWAPPVPEPEDEVNELRRVNPNVTARWNESTLSWDIIYP